MKLKRANATIALFVLLALCVHATEKFWLCVTQVAFLACVMAHIAVSVGEAFFTVKWAHTPAAVHRIDKVMYVICAIVFLISVSGAIRFFIVY